MKTGISKILSVCFIFLFSFALVFLSEYIQVCSVLEVFCFMTEKCGVMLFCTAVVFFFTLSMICIAKSTSTGCGISGAVIYIISCIEYYKYTVSGSHLVVADVVFAGNVGDISGFAEVLPEAHIFRAGAALILLVIAFSRVRIPIPKSRLRSLAASVLCFLMMIALVSPTVATLRAYEALAFDTEPAVTTMGMNDRFENDGFLGFLSQNATEYIDSDITPPEGYSESLMKRLCENAEKKESSSEYPNVIIIASESFSDLRAIGEGVVSDEAYKDFDAAARLGSVGECILPTFGGYTVRSEFELLFGLPAMSMKNVPSPHSMLEEKESYNTVVREFCENGYKTVYIHPFEESFYNRNVVYPKYGFDKLVFRENFDEEKDVFRRYIGDGALFDKIKNEITLEEKPVFLFAMSMQNHQPYVEEDGTGEGELEYYLEGIGETSVALCELFAWLEASDEETLLLFVGDHYPFFTPQGGVYDALCPDGIPSDELYRQKYILYSNRKRFAAENETVSLFYLPHILIDKAGITKSSFVMTMLSEMKEKPIYSVVGCTEKENRRLDAITYDRTLGENYTK